MTYYTTQSTFGQTREPGVATMLLAISLQLVAKRRSEDCTTAAGHREGASKTETRAAEWGRGPEAISRGHYLGWDGGHGGGYLNGRCGMLCGSGVVWADAVRNDNGHGWYTV